MNECGQVMLSETFANLLKIYNADERLIHELWYEIEKCYSGTTRYYHTLQHLHHLMTVLNEVKEEIEDWQTILFSLYYHDVIYNPLRSDNEVKSAELAEKRMKKISTPEVQIKHCKEQIFATKSHGKSADSDTNYFTDADLSILGHGWEAYSEYCKNIRKEYSIYPDIVYNRGRKKVLKHFLEMERIFKTNFFHDRYEIQAKQNLVNELHLLDGV